MNARKPLMVDVAVVGLGIVGVHQLTREAAEVLRRCTKVFVADTGAGALDYLRSHDIEAVDLSTAGLPHEHRILAYRRMASEVVSAAVAQAPVGFATYGHPTMYCYPTTLIQRAAIVLDLSVKILPGISFLDQLLCDLGVDPGFDGLQLYEATDLLVRHRPLQSDVSCVITQAPMVANPYDRPGERDLDHLTRLQNYLLAFYPAGHQAMLVTSAPHPLLDPLIQPATVGSLAAALVAGHQLSTLFIPPVTHRPIADDALAAAMRRIDEPGTGSAGPPRRPGRPPIGPQPTVP